jgi:methyl-accepting chemotaxis protein
MVFMRLRLSIPRQFTLLGMLGVLVTLVALGIGLRTSYDVALQERKAQIQNLTDAAVSMTEGFVALAEQGKMTTAQAQQGALTALRAARFDDGNYYFVFDSANLFIAMPVKSYIGTNGYIQRDPYGKLKNAPMIDGARAGRPVFNSYYIPKAGESTPQPKTSYAAAVPEWGWVIGTGIYTNDLRSDFIGRVIGLSEIFVPLFVVFLGLIFFMNRGVSSLLSSLTAAMDKIAGAQLDADIPGLERKDDVGRMARRVAQFRDDAVAKRAFEARVEADRSAAEAERAANEAARAEAAKQQEFVVHAVATGLEKLSSGDLLFRLTTDFGGDYEKLRGDFNATMEKLQETMQSIAANTQGVQGGASEITQAADDLSRRTEQQAASLEETAAALDQITATVRRTAEVANEARDLVSTSKEDAERSGDVVRNTVQAMSEIESSSKQIANIIGVIDEIAFQTNLLALNAGVEAARAGDAGRGFAVVATEVRALAQRSADAAKEIKALISASGTQVTTGVKLVSETGQALGRIAVQVTQLNGLVAELAASAKEQATGLGEVNAAVNQMDQVTQQNAAMVEQATAASHGLSGEAHELARLVGQFRIGESVAAPVLKRAASKTLPQKRVVTASARKVAMLPRQDETLAVADAEENWSES